MSSLYPTRGEDKAYILRRVEEMELTSFGRQWVEEKEKNVQSCLQVINANVQVFAKETTTIDTIYGKDSDEALDSIRHAIGWLINLESLQRR